MIPQDVFVAVTVAAAIPRFAYVDSPSGSVCVGICRICDKVVEVPEGGDETLIKGHKPECPILELSEYAIRPQGTREAS